MKSITFLSSLHAVLNEDDEPVAILGSEEDAEALVHLWNNLETDGCYHAQECWIDTDVTKRISL